MTSAFFRSLSSASMFKKEWKGFVVLMVVVSSPMVFSTCKQKCGYPSAWLPVAKNVCYGTKGDSYGRFKIDADCHMYAVRLSHVSGYVSCCKDYPDRRSSWGYSATNPRYLSTIILRNNQLWCPETIGTGGNYKLDGFTCSDDVIILKMNATLRAGTELQVGHGMDYRKKNEDKSEGTHCVDVDISCIV